MTEPVPHQTRTRRGRSAFWALFVVVAGIVVAIKVWPGSLDDRRDAAVGLCKTEVDAVEPTPGRKLWQESSFQVGGDQVITVWGRFAAKDADPRQFTCEVEDGKVTSSQVGPAK
ncbi:hypothetical protein Aab01nite_55040 [Paractinoplanes abujensis]|uniref:Uncharacterized protein n=1 Tax=Paractinoplanes abujensis TaxID=882441 RepID=A0A7W7CWH5_9ACTN|nr:hypothetical protein [Actinoplanes abujensis]MBB4695927.1 hypothetical protein [Actinoplanes abujensis]GID21914.1 hypothetical protein Aab01nite_55040 [Actinoplanes abujensis]